MHVYLQVASGDLTHGKDWCQHAGSPSIGGAGGRVCEGRQTSVGARRQRQRPAAAAGKSSEAAYTTTALHFPSVTFDH